MAGTQSLLPLKFVIAFGSLIAAVAIALTWNFETTGEPALERAEEVSAETRPVEHDLVSEQPHGEPASVDLFHSDEVDGAREAIRSSILMAFIRGTVMDPDSKPVAGAKIAVAPANLEYIQAMLPLGDFHAELVSDSSGRFAVNVPQAGAFSLQIEKKGFAPHLVRFALPGDDLEIMLNKGVTLEGMVVHEESEIPLEGVKVFTTSHESETDEHGVFALKDLPQGTVNLSAFHAGYDLGRMSAVLVQEDHENFVKITLKEGAPLAGQVMDKADEQPLSGVHVNYTIGYRTKDEVKMVYEEECVTDAKGKFQFEKISRRGYRLQVSAQGYSLKLCEPFKKINDPNALMRVHLEKVGAVSGRVYDPDGLPVEGALVRVFQRELFETREIATRSEASGQFLLTPLAAEAIRVYASHSRFGPAFIDDIVIPPGDTIEGIELYLTQTAAIEGRVLGPDGAPVKQARVVLNGVRPHLTRYFELYPIDFSDGEGCFRFNKLPEGEYRVSACNEGMRSPPLDVVLLGGDEISLDVALEDGLTLSGMVADPFGDPLDDVLVTAFAVEPDWIEADTGKMKSKVRKRLEKSKASKAAGSWESPAQIESELLRFRRPSQSRGSTRTGPNGRFTLSGFLESDSNVLRLWKYGFNPRTITGVPASSEELYLELSPMCQVQGVVIDSTTFEPLPAFSVELMARSKVRLPTRDKKGKGLSRPSREGGHTFRSGDGTFLIESVEPGHYEVRVQAKGYQKSKPTSLLLFPGDPAPYLEIQMDLSGRLKGRVQGSNKAPVKGITVYLRPAAPGSKPSPREREARKNKVKSKTKKKPKSETATSVIRGRTGEDGRFEFKDLKPGTYDILLGDARAPVVKPKRVGVKKGESTSRAFVLTDLGLQEFKVRDEAGFSLKSRITLTGGPGSALVDGETDSLGTLRVENLVQGRYRLMISTKGFRTLKQTITIKEGRNPLLDLFLTKKIKK